LIARSTSATVIWPCVTPTHPFAVAKKAGPTVAAEPLAGGGLAVIVNFEG
jgi:hypothetical protein